MIRIGGTMKFGFGNIILSLALAAASVTAYAAEPAADGTVTEAADEEVDVQEIIFGHIGDSYEWHITDVGDRRISIPLPVIVRSSTGWHCFLSSRLEENHGSYEGFSIAPTGSPYEGKLVEHDAAGNEVRPFDISITKVTLALFINSALLLVIILSVARWYKRHPKASASPGGFVGCMEMFIMMINSLILVVLILCFSRWYSKHDALSEAPRGVAALFEPVIAMINDDVIKDAIGPGYAKYSTYLLTVFFFILINNLMGIIPFFPGGANVTGNITITFVLAVGTFILTNFTTNRHYWKDIFWPDVPLWLKPILIIIEIFGVFTKPFALMVRLFANIMAGHSLILCIVAMIFITAKLGAAIGGTMTVVSVVFGIFMDCLELLVAFIQAYVFTMLSAVFIGLARVHPEAEKGAHIINSSNRR